jgi:hypothetical protein
MYPNQVPFTPKGTVTQKRLIYSIYRGFPFFTRRFNPPFRPNDRNLQGFYPTLLGCVAKSTEARPFEFSDPDTLRRSFNAFIGYKQTT